MKIDRAVPVLQVKDVAKSIIWYGNVLGFSSDPFPEDPPYSFAILRRDDVEIMLQCSFENAGNTVPTLAVARSGWTIYLRLLGGQLLALAAAARQHTQILRGPERMFYGQVEFEIADPDGYRLCIAEVLTADAPVPPAKE